MLCWTKSVQGKVSDDEMKAPRHSSRMNNTSFFCSAMIDFWKESLALQRPLAPRDWLEHVYSSIRHAPDLIQGRESISPTGKDSSPPAVTKAFLNGLISFFNFSFRIV